MALLSLIPMTGLLLAAYLGIQFVDLGVQLDTQMLVIKLVSGAEWELLVKDLLILLGILSLYVELFKATRTTNISVIDHMLSLLVFIAFLVLFLVLPEAGTSTFLILAFISLTDVVAGFTITITSARRDFQNH